MSDQFWSIFIPTLGRVWLVLNRCDRVDWQTIFGDVRTWLVALLSIELVNPIRSWKHWEKQSKYYIICSNLYFGPLIFKHRLWSCKLGYFFIFGDFMWKWRSDIKKYWYQKVRTCPQRHHVNTPSKRDQK